MPPSPLSYEIIVTLGPASSPEAAWQELLKAGATAFRLNTSHLTMPALIGWLQRLSTFKNRTHNQFPIVLDLQGSKWRLGSFDSFFLKEGQTIELILAASTGTAGVLPVPHADFFRAAPGASGEIVLDDAKIRLQMIDTHAESIQAKVTLGGEIVPNKGITLSESNYRLETLSEKDRAIIDTTGALKDVRYAVSYLRDAAEMARYRELINGLLGYPGYLIAKLEREQAILEAAQVAKTADELWLCRGDLGAETGLRKMAKIVLQFSAAVQEIPVPCMMAGQVLEHMTTHATPTRSEVCYLFESLALRYQGFVLSDETAIGRNPVEACRIAALFR
jgi:pyruvate kinase